MSYPQLEYLKRMRLFEDVLCEVSQRTTFVETEQLLRAHMQDVRNALSRATDSGKPVVIDHNSPVLGKAEVAFLRAYFAGLERGARIGSERGQRMREESRQFVKNSIRNTAPWLLNDEHEME